MELLCNEGQGCTVTYQKSYLDKNLIKDDRVLERLLKLEDHYIPRCDYFKILQKEIKPYFTFSPPFWRFFDNSFLDFFRILLFLFLASSRFFIISWVELLTSHAMSTMTIWIRANTFSKNIIEYDPYVFSNPDFGNLCFRPFFVVLLPIVCFAS